MAAMDEQLVPHTGPISQEEMDEWKWYIDPTATTEQDIRQAQCRRQPTYRQMFYVNGDGHGPERQRFPPANLEDRPLNDYDHLFDTRVYSPNGKSHIPWDWDPEEIERENAFTPPDLSEYMTEDSPRPSSPWPEPGSREAMFIGSLGEEDRPRSPGLPIFEDYTIHNAGVIGIRHEDVPSFVERFRSLPCGLQAEVIVRQREEDIFWMNALEQAESQVWWFKFTPTMRQIIKHIQTTLAMVEEILEHEEEVLDETDDELMDIFGFRSRLPIVISSELKRYFHTYVHDGSHIGRSVVARPVEGIFFFLTGIKKVDRHILRQPAEKQAVWGEIRKTMVFAALLKGRIDHFEELKDELDKWLGLVGDKEAEQFVFSDEGGFWTMHTTLRREVEEADEAFGKIRPWQDVNVTVEDLEFMLDLAD
jgi:hypothetical protein